MYKHYDPKKIEIDCYNRWEQSGLFDSKDSNRKSYNVVFPPPNVTGTLHMGHGFQHTLMDILVRYHRMMGFDTLWQPGTDHAGIATQMLVEKKLLKQGISKHDLGRKSFIDEVWKWKNNSSSTITKQMRRLGSSLDWSKEHFTMDESLSDSVQKAFLKLYEDGLIYRGKKLVNWDPKLLTALSDLEVLHEEEKATLWYIKYSLVENHSQYLEIATTRPETLFGDSAVAVHPEDERYKKFIGMKVVVPLINKEIIVIADDSIEKDFGTGCVKVTPAHDFNDYDLGKKHNLEFTVIFDKHAKLNKNVPDKYQKLYRFDARTQVVKDLTDLGLLIKSEAHITKIPKGDRTGTILEPYLTKQWFIKVSKLAEPTINAIKSNKIKFIPDMWKNTYFSWMNNLQDWCISRQLWWGHRIPVWYDDKSNIYVGQNEKHIRKKYNLHDNLILVQDTDVFDTWFSSALWPFSTLGWPKATKLQEKYYHANVVVTGFDIIFFWIARMMMFGMYFMQDVPFKHIYVTGLICDSKGKKMSKSKGNIIDPVDLIDGINLEKLIEKRTSHLMQSRDKNNIIQTTKMFFPNGIKPYGTDALRFTFSALASTSRDINFDISRMEGYRNFCNKIWNAARFVDMTLKDYSLESKFELGVTDKWIWHEFNELVKNIHVYIRQYRFDLLANAIYDFVWYKYCDWYIEFSKIAIHNDAKPAHQAGTRYTLIKILESILKVAHPIIPFITENIFQHFKQQLKSNDKFIMTSEYPVFRDHLQNMVVKQEVNWIQDIINTLRNMRSETGIQPNMTISLYIDTTEKPSRDLIEKMSLFIKKTCKVDTISFGIDNKLENLFIKVCNELKLAILLPQKDISVDKKRLNKELEKIEVEISFLKEKLSNIKFITNAPKDIVNKNKEKLIKSQERFRNIRNQLK